MIATRNPISVVITTLNNESTLEACLSSVCWADEIVVVDSGSTDCTHNIAKRYDVRWSIAEFKGYGPQKQYAISLAKHDWILLLDADEVVPTTTSEIIQHALINPSVYAFVLQRQEQAFWRFHHRWVRHNRMLRLFHRDHIHFTTDIIHAAPTTNARFKTISSPFLHFGEPNISTKVKKINSYADGAVLSKKNMSCGRLVLGMTLYPSWFFLRNYFWKRKFLSGLAGFIACVIEAFYVFLKYAKTYEQRQTKGTITHNIDKPKYNNIRPL